MKKLLSLLLIGSFAISLVQAQSLDEVLKNYYTNVGGLDNWHALQSTRMTGRANQMGMEFPFTMVMTRPNKQKLVVNIQGTESAEAAKQMFEDDLMDYKAKGHQASLEGDDEVEGTRTFVVKLTTKAGDERFYYIDRDNYVPLMIKTFAGTGQMKGMPIEQHLSDYAEVNGMMMPHSMTTKVNGEVVAQLTFDRIETNVGVKEDLFSFPGDK